MAKAKAKGMLQRIAGPVVVAKGLSARMYDVVRVGKERLMGEVIRIDAKSVTIQERISITVPKKIKGAILIGILSVTVISYTLRVTPLWFNIPESFNFIEIDN